MSDAATVSILRAARDGARSRFENGLQQVKSDVEVRSVGARIAGKLESDAKAAGIYALDVIEDNKGLIGGTLAALGIWFFREPITAWVEEHFGGSDKPEDIQAEFEDMIDE